LTTDGKCAAQCPAGFYGLLAEDSAAGSCLTCSDKCLACDGPNTCSSCLNGRNMLVSVKPALSNSQFQEYFADDGLGPCRGSLNCPDNLSFFNNQLKTCQSCAVGCANCTSATKCTLKCDDTCGDCFGTPDNCIACNAGEMLVDLGNGTSTCRSKCDDGEFYDEDKKRCKSCMDGCNNCNNATDCLECDAGLFYNLGAEENACLDSCPKGTNADSNGNCSKCSEGCDECDSDGACLTCNAFTTLAEDKCVCEFNYEITARPTSQYIQIDFFNLYFNDSSVNITSGKRFDCDEIFDFDSSSAANFDLSDLRCYGKDLTSNSTLKQRITIRSKYEEQLNLLVNEDVRISLNST